MERPTPLALVGIAVLVIALVVIVASSRVSPVYTNKVECTITFAYTVGLSVTTSGSVTAVTTTTTSVLSYTTTTSGSATVGHVTGITKTFQPEPNVTAVAGQECTYVSTSVK